MIHSPLSPLPLKLALLSAVLAIVLAIPEQGKWQFNVKKVCLIKSIEINQTKKMY